MTESRVVVIGVLASYSSEGRRLAVALMVFLLDFYWTVVTQCSAGGTAVC